MAKKQPARTTRGSRAETPTSPPGAPRGRRGPSVLALIAGLLVVIAIVAWWWRRGPAFSVESRVDRNVLLVSIDTLRADVLG